MNAEQLKRMAAAHAVSLVEDGMVLGLGTGSTVAHFIDMLAERVRARGWQVVGVPTSERTAQQAREVGIPLTTLDEHPALDLAVDGADEVDAALNLIKGRGRALLREKIVAVHARRLVIIVDASKIVERLGTRGPLPVEILPFAARAHVRWLESLGCRAEILTEPSGEPARTDNGHYLAMCHFPRGISDPHALADRLNARPGILEHGLFLDMTDMVIVGTEEGVKVLERGTRFNQDVHRP